jgi:hypothetical protein
MIGRNVTYFERIKTGQLVVSEPWLPELGALQVEVLGRSVYARGEAYMLRTDRPISWDDCLPTNIVVVSARNRDADFLEQRTTMVNGCLWTAPGEPAPGFIAQLTIDDPLIE